MASNEVRIDKWLWAVRIFKTRTIASDAIKMGRVTIGGQKVKPSRNVKVGEVIDVKKPPITYSFKVLALAENRMGAKLVPGFMENVTRKEQLDLLFSRDLTLQNDIEQVPLLTQFVDEVCESIGLPSATAMQMNLALEEAV